VLAAVGWLAPLGSSALAATLCVDQKPHSACAFNTINAAVSNAAPGDTVKVMAGRYQEDVHITKPLSLIGAGAANTIIDAASQSNGVFIDGNINGTPGNNTLTDVTVSGFTVENANLEGILIANASYVTVWHNSIIGNDRSLANGTCPGAPAFETNEAFDCGEGIHLTGVDHSTIAANDVERNAGGILVSDETGPTHDNLIAGNKVANNPYDCGITLASHDPYGLPSSPPSPAWGVFRNTIAENDSSNNGHVTGDGAGVGLFAPGPKKATYGNVVIGNRLTGNSLPGVAMHSHAPSQNLNDNVITANYIAGNGGDTDVESSPVQTGISLLAVSPNSGTVITRNTIKDEATDIAINLANNGNTTVDVHLNNLIGDSTGIANLAAGSINGTMNWWGCANGPSSPGCSTVEGNVTTFPFLEVPLAAQQGNGLAGG
jgi:hypothetical protein